MSGRAPRRACAGMLVLTLGLLSFGCNQRAIESWLSETNSGPSLYDEKQFSRALAQLKKHVPRPVEALSLLVYADHLVLQAQDPAVTTNVLQYVYRAGTVSEPEQVKLLGTGKLDDNLFSLDTVKLESLPALVRAAERKANIPEGVVARVLLKRNLPESTDIQFRVFVSSQRRDAFFDADRNGTLLE